MIDVGRVVEFQLVDAEGRAVPDGFAFDSVSGEILALGGSDGRIGVLDPVIHFGGSWPVLTAPGRATAVPNFNLVTQVPVVFGEGSITRGVLIDRAGKPRHGVTLAATEENYFPDQGQPKFVSPPALTDTLGRFTIHGLRKGERVSIWWMSPTGPRLAGTRQAGRDGLKIGISD